MSPAIRHKYKYFHSTVQRAKYRREKFHFCRLSFDVRPRNAKLNLSIIRDVLKGSPKFPPEICAYYLQFPPSWNYDQIELGLGSLGKVETLGTRL